MIQQLIESIVLTLSVEDSTPSVPPDFIHGWKGQLNLRLDELQNDVVWLLPVQSNTTLVGALTKDRYSVVLGFFGKSELEWFADEHLPVIDRQRRQCSKFIYAARNSVSFSEVSEFIITDEYNAFDVGLSGVTLQMKITPLIGYPVC